LDVRHEDRRESESQNIHPFMLDSVVSGVVS